MGTGRVNHEKSKARVGERHGRLVLIEWLFSNKYRRAVFKCQCDCGNSCVKTSLSLRPTASCGCWGAARVVEAKTIHGHSPRRGPSGIYTTWQAMCKRCENPKNHDYKWYGLKGVRVCDEWREFKTFLCDMEPTWFEGATIDRIDSNGNYCKENCRWLSGSENARRAALATWESRRSAEVRRGSRE